MGTIVQIAAARTGKLLVALWILALVILVAVPVTGLFQGEFLGSLAFSVLPVTILLNISIVLAHYVENGSVRIAKAAWLGVAVAALLITLYAFDGRPNSDIGIFLAWFTLVLAFPISLLVALLFTGVAIAAEKLFSAVIPESYLLLLVNWVCFIAAGYWQWFVLLPWLWRKWKTLPLQN
ncbi:MAG TPA: hypothetical protein VN929_18990 [Burkholderiales bacterium]|nr:hypothetical protein [Burkholderiales bacterium]